MSPQPPRDWPRGTKEYLSATISADVDLTDDVPIWFTFDREVFLEGEWVGDVGMSRACRLLVDDSILPPDLSLIDVHIRIDDNPEVPLIPVGQLNIT